MDKYELFYRVKGRRFLFGLFCSLDAAKAHRDQVHAAEERRMRMPTMLQIRRVPAHVEVSA